VQPEIINKLIDLRLTLINSAASSTIIPLTAKGRKFKRNIDKVTEQRPIQD
jgi:predicted transcriptional regulator